MFLIMAIVLVVLWGYSGHSCSALLAACHTSC